MEGAHKGDDLAQRLERLKADMDPNYELPVHVKEDSTNFRTAVLDNIEQRLNELKNR